ncbi:MAG: hypothetical protein IJH18_01045 [Bacilli bacterium]|nr:hypothetical protein [Bacilli bacterium]
MKKALVTTGILLIMLGFVFLYRKEIAFAFNKYFLNKVIKVNTVVTLDKKNSYYRNKNYNYVQQTTSFVPENKQDLLNIYYTIINSGEKSFSFYCPKDYENCLNDVKAIANNQTTLSDINNFVHPFNGFTHISTEYDPFGKVKLHVHKTYTDEEIKKIEKKIDEITEEVIKDNMSTRDKIKAFHDYVINHSKYDSLKSDQGIDKYHSDTAIGTLFEGYSLCGGYTDTMAIFLNKIGVNNYKVSSENHIWNAVELDGSWYHLDLTWDDPVATDGSDILDHSFFLINTTELEKKEVTQHDFNSNVFSEVY